MVLRNLWPATTSPGAITGRMAIRGMATRAPLLAIPAAQPIRARAPTEPAPRESWTCGSGRTVKNGRIVKNRRTVKNGRTVTNGRIVKN